MNALTLEKLGLTAEDRLLEVGYGSGYLLAKVLEEGSCAFSAGVDLSADMVKLGCRRFRAFIGSGRAELRQGDVAHLPFSEAEFTKVCSVNTLYFWPDPSAALAECRRVLRPGGILALCFNSKTDLEAFLGDTRGFTLYELSEVEALLAEAGFGRIAVAHERDPHQGLFYCVTATAV
jgi:arsenite methyltransferase